MDNYNISAKPLLFICGILLFIIYFSMNQSDALFIYHFSNYFSIYSNPNDIHLIGNMIYISYP
jgi:hypothetical protein